MIRKLNKKLIYFCIMGSTVIAILLMVIPLFQDATKKQTNHEKSPAQAYVGADDAFALSGTEKFPANYGAVQDFEQKEIKPNSPTEEEPLLDIFTDLSTLDQQGLSEPEQNFQVKKDPWQEAKEQEIKQQAFDHYAARRSDILFVDHSKKKQRKPKNQDEDPMLRILERSLNTGQAQAGSHDAVFFKRPNVSQKQNKIGKIKKPYPFMLSEGTLIPTVLVSEIDTSLPGPILARVSHNIWDSKTGKALLIPQNSTLIGKYNSQVTHGQNRAQVVWSRIIFPNQQSVNLGEMVGVDKRGVSGASGQVNNHYDKVALGLLLTTTLGAEVRLTQGKYDANSATLGQEMGNILAQETARLGNKITEKMLAIPPTIKVPMGKRLNVFVEQDLKLQPYQG